MGKTLQETKLTILKDEECNVFADDNSGLDFVPGQEFCAALRIPFPRIKVYERKRKKKEDRKDGQKYRFKFVEELKNKVGAQGKQGEMDYYLGNSDSCQGDSGGPLWQYTDGKATVIGVVSRGGDCAAFNSPGIYTNIQKHLDWIHEKIHKYNC